MKQVQMKNEFKYSDISFMHNHALHGTLHQIYVFLFEIGMPSEKGLGPDKSFRKTFGREECNSNRSFKIDKILMKNDHQTGKGLTL